LILLIVLCPIVGVLFIRYQRYIILFCVSALVIIHEVPPWCAVGLTDWYAVSSADNYRRTIAEGITEGTISLNVGMRKCGNAL